MNFQIKSALISVYHKEGLEPIVHELQRLGITIYSTGGTYDFLLHLGVKAIKVEDYTGYPEIFGGRVKTLHPKVFGAILARRENEGDIAEMRKHEIPPIDLVVVDLYPFESTVASGATHAEIIEKIDIGGISLIRAAAKNYKHLLVVPSRNHYHLLSDILTSQNGKASEEQRKHLAGEAFAISSNYDGKINEYLVGGNKNTSLRYGENPHQKARYHGNLNEVFEQLAGKELSYNNLLDIDAALNLISELPAPSFAVVKHNNPCGVAAGKTVLEAWNKALEADSVSAFGGILATNSEIDETTASAIDSIFFEVCMAPSFSTEALAILSKKKNRMLLKTKPFQRQTQSIRTALNGTLVQEADTKTEGTEDLKTVTKKAPTSSENSDMLFANVIAKNAKSNTIVLVKNKQLLGIGVGQTSRVDACRQAIDRAKEFNLSLDGAVMASDAFFPFSDCAQLAKHAGITAIIQPGGSIRDIDSITYCDENNLAMVFTGVRHFKH